MLVLAVLTMAVSLSERAQAQQGGLFPLAPIRRERPPCSNEDPVYKYYKQRYFGYHPTCWTPFPAGWGCPSKETADKEKAFREQPLDSKPAMEEEGPLPGEDMGQPRGGPIRPNVPDTPPERDPFLDNDMPGAAPLPRPNAQPRRPAQGGASPFEDLNNPGASTTPARRNSRGRTVAPIRNDDAPSCRRRRDSPKRIPRNEPQRPMRRRSRSNAAIRGRCWLWRISMHPAQRREKSSRTRSRCSLRTSPPRRRRTRLRPRDAV